MYNFRENCLRSLRGSGNVGDIKISYTRYGTTRNYNVGISPEGRRPGANLCDFFIKQKIFFLYLTQTYDMSFFVYL